MMLVRSPLYYIFITIYLIHCVILIAARESSQGMLLIGATDAADCHRNIQVDPVSINRCKQSYMNMAVIYGG